MKNLLGAIAGKVLDIVKEIIPDKDKHKELENKVQMAMLDLAPVIIELFKKQLKARKSIIIAEAKSGNWLAASWRPIIMLFFAFLLGAHWFGFTPVNMSDEILTEILTIIKYGITGYIIGRSGEKIVNKVMDKVKNGQGNKKRS